ncbi:MAG: hypothetical protein COA49_09445 [Bacteroidetes bacterium]|nr:MAG: hypothetical protein COA49_09445 [Bacteroidota bacterium]
MRLRAYSVFPRQVIEDRGYYLNGYLSSEALEPYFLKMGLLLRSLTSHYQFMKVLIAEDQPPIIITLEKIIKDIYPSAEVSSSLTTTKAIKLLKKNQFNLVISDLDFEEGKRFTVADEARKKKTPCIIYSLYYNKTLTDKAKELKAVAYVCKLGKLDHIIYAIQSYRELSHYRCPVTIRKQVTTSSKPIKRIKIGGREEEMLRLIISGQTQKEVSETMGITINTVRSNLRDIIKKNESTLPQIIRNYLEWNHPK